MKKSFAKGFTEPKFSLASIFVWTVWVMMLLIAFACVFTYGRNIPLAEDWHMVAPLTGNESDFIGWLWAQNNEHRIPLPKLILLLALKIGNGDFRIGMALTIVCLGLLAALFIVVFYKIRGSKSSYTDAFFPIVFLHLGNWENLFWSWEFTFVLATILFCIIVSVVMKYQIQMNISQALTALVCAICLPLCGANGLLYLFPVIPYLAFDGYKHLKLREKTRLNRRVGYILISASVLSIFVLIFYFIGYESPQWYAKRPTIVETLQTGVKFMALSLGPIADASWTASSLVILILLIPTIILLIVMMLKCRGADFRKAVGLFLFLGGNVLFAFALGYGRATLVPTLGLPMRYALLAAPILIICYGSWQLYGTGFSGKIVQWFLFLTMLVLIYPNTRKGFVWKKWYVKNANQVLHDIKTGIPQSELINRHQKFLLHWNKHMLKDGMLELKRAGIGAFKDMKEDTVL